MVDRASQFFFLSPFFKPGGANSPFDADKNLTWTEC